MVLFQIALIAEIVVFVVMLHPAVGATNATVITFLEVEGKKGQSIGLDRNPV